MASSAHSVSFNASVLNQIMSLTHKPGPNMQPAFAGGKARPAAFFSGEMVQSADLTTSDLASLLALNSGTIIGAGMCITGAVTSMPFRLRADCSEFASGTSHQAIQCSNTFVTIESISGKANEAATAAVMTRFKSSDGFTPPCSVVSSQSLSDASFIGEYQLHSILVNDVAIPELQSVEIKTGIKVVEQRATGPFVISHYIVEGLPTISITTENVAYAAAVLNAASIGTGISINFAKRKNGAIIEDLEDEVHIQITAATGFGQADSIGGDVRQVAQNTVVFNPFSLTSVTGAALA